MEDLNFLTIIIATVVSFAIGFAWYSPKLFGTKWAKLQGFGEMQMNKEKEGMAKSVTMALILEFILIGAFNYTLVVTNVNAYCIALLFTIGIILPIMGGSTIWQKKPMEVLCIDWFYRVVSFTAVAFIFSMMM